MLELKGNITHFRNGCTIWERHGASKTWIYHDLSQKNVWPLETTCLMIQIYRYNIDCNLLHQHVSQRHGAGHRARWRAGRPLRALGRSVWQGSPPKWSGPNGCVFFIYPRSICFIDIVLACFGVYWLKEVGTSSQMDFVDESLFGFLNWRPMYCQYEWAWETRLWEMTWWCLGLLPISP